VGDWVLAAAIGFGSGILSGAFGIGGGIVTTPAIRLILGAPALIAVGTPLPVIIPSAIAGALSYRREGLLDVRAGVVLAAAGSLTSVAGAWLTRLAGGTVVLMGTAAFIFVAAADMITQVLRPPRAVAGHATALDSEGEGARPSRSRLALLPLVTIGALTGLYSGFFGLGGGFVLVPLLTRWLRVPLKHAIGTSLVAVSLLAIPGTITHALLGHVDWSIVLPLALGVVPGAVVGARLTLGARESRVRIAFATLLVLVAAVLAGTELGWLSW